MVNLLELCKNLQQKIEKLEAKIEKLEAEIENLRAENKALKIENAELKESKFKKLINFQFKRIIQNEKGKAKSERKIGGQVGHKGNYRAKMEADEVIKIELSSTCECGGKIAICEKPYIHQKVDLPEIKAYVMSWNIAVVRDAEKEEVASYQRVLRQIHLAQGLSQ